MASKPAADHPMRGSYYWRDYQGESDPKQYRVGADKDGLSRSDRQRIEDIKERKTYGDEMHVEYWGGSRP